MGAFDFDRIGPMEAGIEEVRYAELEAAMTELDAPLFPDEEREEPAVPEPETKRNPKRVFIVYGRNQAAYDQVELFLLRLKLDPKPFREVTAETGGAPYIGDVIKQGMNAAQAIVVLFTPDERATLVVGKQSHDSSTDAGRLQARPNVIFEAGMALGAHEERTILVTMGASADLFSDLSGRHVVRLNNSTDARETFRTRLIGVGCAVDKDATGWPSAGDFESCVQAKPEATPSQAPPIEPVSDDDALIRLHAWLRRLPHSELPKAHTFAGLDGAERLPPGTTSRLLPQAVTAHGSYTLERGTTDFMLKRIPPPPNPTGGGRGWDRI